MTAPASPPVAGVDDTALFLAILDVRQKLSDCREATKNCGEQPINVGRVEAYDLAISAITRALASPVSGDGSSSPKSEDTQSAAERLAVAEAEIARLTAANNDLRSIPWPRAYVLERASEWKRLLREVNGYLKTCRGSCGSDMAGRDHAIAASDALIAMLAEATPSAASVSPVKEAGND